MNLKQAAKNCAKDQLTQDQINSILSQNSVNNLKAFLMIIAKNELSRIVSLTESLMSLEKVLSQQIEANKDYMDIGTIAELIKTLQKSLEKSIALVQSVCKDPEFMPVFLVNNSSTNIIQANVLGLSDPGSREKVRMAALELLKVIGSGSDRGQAMSIDKLAGQGEANGTAAKAGEIPLP